jgi:hypothetical protein
MLTVGFLPKTKNKLNLTFINQNHMQHEVLLDWF